MLVMVSRHYIILLHFFIYINIALIVQDTAAHTMAFTLLELTKPENKRVLDKVLHEIDSVIPSSDSHSRLVLLST